jgi:hypothetical protein
MLITFFNVKGNVHFEFIPWGKQSTKITIWKCWSSYMQLCSEKGLNLWPNDWILHHDIAPAHKALSVKQFSDQKIDYWNGKPILVPWIGWLFPKIKSS